jgi:hypothetical protein
MLFRGNFGGNNGRASLKRGVKSPPQKGGKRSHDHGGSN